MKTAIVMCVLAALCGCDSGHEKRLQALEAKVVKLETNVADLKWNVNLALDRTDQMITNYLDMIKVVSNMNSDSKAFVQAMFEASLEAQRESAKPPAVARQPVKPTAAGAQTRDGVPIAVYNAIAADAVKEWPNNYEMQAYTIRKQVEAYKKLHP